MVFLYEKEKNFFLIKIFRKYYFLKKPEAPKSDKNPS